MYYTGLVESTAMDKRKHKNDQNSASVGKSSVYFEQVVPRSASLALLSSGAKFAVSKYYLLKVF